MPENSSTVSEPPEPRRRLFLLAGKFWAFFFALGNLCLLALLLLLIFLPGAVEKQVNKVLAELNRDGALSLQVKHIGLFNSDFAFQALQDQEEDKEALRIVSFRLEYGPFEILKRRIRRIQISGVSLCLDLSGEGPLLPLLELLPASQPKDSAQEPRPLAEIVQNLPFSFKHLLLDGSLLLYTGQEEFPVACYANIHCAAPGHWTYVFKTRNSLNSLVSYGICAFDQEQINGKLLLNGQSAFLPNSLKERLPEGLDFSLQGLGSYSLDLNKPKQSSIQAELDCLWKYKHDELKIESESEVRLQLQEGRAAAQVSAIQGSYSGYDFALEDIKLEQPLQARLELSGQLKLRALQQALLTAELKLQKTAELLKLTVRQKPEQAINALEFYHAGMNINSSIKALEAELNLDAELAYQAELELGESSLQQGEMQAESQSAKLQLQGKNGSLKLNADFRGLLLQLASQLKAQAAELGATVSLNQGCWQGNCILPQGSVQLPEQEIEAEFNAELPLLWPLPEAETQGGSLNISRLLWQKNSLADLQGGFTLSKDALSYAAASQLCGLQAQLYAECFPFAKKQQPWLKCRLELPEQDFDLEQLPPKLLPQMQDFQAKASLILNASYEYGAGGGRGEASLRLKNGELSNNEKNLALQGIRINFEMPDLPRLHSAGNQLLAFQSLALDNIAVNSGRLRFRMEAPSAWHIEGLSLKWCEGNLKMESARINPENRRSVFNFHCDRLRLSALLQQLGVGLDQGEGRISGSLPISFSERGLRVRDAFLYSTPGETGSIKLRPSAGIAAGAAASTQLSFALAALANFDYEWVKLNMNSEKEMLKIQLASNGRPQDKLYYIPKDGSLEHSELANEFTGLMLNLNLNIPLESSIKFYQDLQKKIQPGGE